MAVFIYIFNVNIIYKCINIYNLIYYIVLKNCFLLAIV